MENNLVPDKKEEELKHAELECHINYQTGFARILESLTSSPLHLEEALDQYIKGVNGIIELSPKLSGELDAAIKHLVDFCKEQIDNQKADRFKLIGRESICFDGTCLQCCRMSYQSKSLRCSHVICRFCIRDVYCTNKEKRNYLFKCPIIDCSYILTQRELESGIGVGSLNHIIPFQINQKECPMCHSDCEEAKKAYFDCEHFLCLECIRSYIEYDPLRNVIEKTADKKGKAIEVVKCPFLNLSLIHI
eukprot:TRINITY_DN5964_c0_g1_i2.p1 TRINITY_DN5964_c0_g1~~TRINITY_DN5964_c0_g1_i2.p1  ORF type:complete len:248 (+),score=38.97 TRINITY_DN5964_c0_g1_i2:40-783(+)